MKTSTSNNASAKQAGKTSTRRQERRWIFFTVSEAGLKFKVNLSDYLDTGLFLDHRITRNMVREQSKDKSVLNLFCYTASFSVYAAAGGASSVVSVDLSKTYLSWAEDNFRLNNLEDNTKYQFVHADVLQYLDELSRKVLISLFLIRQLSAIASE